MLPSGNSVQARLYTQLITYNRERETASGCVDYSGRATMRTHKPTDDVLGAIHGGGRVRIQVHDVTAKLTDSLWSVAKMLKKPIDMIFGDDTNDKNATPLALRKVSFTCKPGEITLVLAPIHSGESTLLRILANQSDNLKLSGSVMYSGHPALNPARCAALLKHVDDAPLEAQQCVAECLLQAAEAAIGKGCGDVTDALLKELQLNDIKYRRIGDLETGIPSHARKRLRLARQLVGNPAVVVCHEPFEDAAPEEAAALMALLRRLADNGHTLVIGTDEGMAQELYQQVDTVLLLSRGKTMYYGAASQAEAWFSAQGHVRPEGASVPDFMVNVSDGALGDDTEEGEFQRAQAVEVAAAYLREYPDGYQGGDVPEMTNDGEVGEDDEDDGAEHDSAKKGKAVPPASNGKAHAAQPPAAKLSVSKD